MTTDWLSAETERGQDGLLSRLKRPDHADNSFRQVRSPGAGPRAHQACKAPAAIRATGSLLSDLQA